MTVLDAFSLTGKRALVTGASRGIGAAIAERLAAEGADVAIVARTLDHHDHLEGSLDVTRQALEPYGGRVAAIVADLTDPDQRHRVVPDAVQALGGPVDILVNNAAAAIYGLVAEFPVRRSRILFEANVHAPLELSQAVIPSMREAGAGWIVNITSGAARPVDGPPFDLGPQGSTIAVYGASKAALRRITNGLGAELYGTGIRVNAVEPRAAVMSEGAAALVGGTVRADQIESIEHMVEAVIALCDCPVEATAMTVVSSDLVASWGLEIHGIDGRAM
jgi:NAD(P)-dependent dehydrogenase (short-subunit alcohol dehydrogenase family)